MAGGYDGTIKIDTKIDTNGFNAGMAKIGDSLKNAVGSVGSAIGKFASTIAIIGVLIGALIVGLVIGLASLAVGIVKFGVNLINEMSQAISRTNEYGKQVAHIEELFANVKGAIYAAFSPLIAAALPYIILIVDWLVKMLNFISMIVAALTGQKTVMQYVAGSAASASTATGRMADNTNKAAKAAKGALAAFDQLNVLAQETANAGAGGGGGGAMQFNIVPVPKDFIEEQVIKPIKLWLLQAGIDIINWCIQAAADISKWIETAFSDIGKWADQAGIDIGKWFLQAWENIKKWAGEAWKWIVDTWMVADMWFYNHVTKPIFDWFAQAWENIKNLVATAWTNIASAWIGASLWYYNNVTTPILNWFATAWENIKKLVILAWTNIVTAWLGASLWFYDHVTKPILDWFRTAWENVTALVVLAWTNIMNAWIGAGAWFKANVIDPIRSGFGSAVTWIQSVWETAFSAIGSFAKGVFNGIIGFFNRMLNGVASGINGLVDVANNVGKSLPGWNMINHVSAPQIPYLAQGAVIPPNAAFAAILGDQRSGRNIEAPESLIRQIVREETGGAGGNITIRFDGNMGELIRVLNPCIVKENQRVGASLIKGVQ